MRHEPPVQCPMCDESCRFTRAGLANHLIRVHAVTRDGATFVANDVAQFARSLARSVTGPQPKYPVVANVGAGYGGAKGGINV